MSLGNPDLNNTKIFNDLNVILNYTLIPNPPYPITYK